ncbi:MAG: hypothetical protein KJ749_02015 [Planctomycetes bacterium]|nr:hypothetical protein [Planctomycetota bacterium]
MVAPSETPSTDSAERFLPIADSYAAEYEELEGRARDANATWDARSQTFAKTRAEFVAIHAAMADLSERFDSEGAGASLSSWHKYIGSALEDAVDASERLISGLEAPDRGELRNEAMSDLLIAGMVFRGRVGELRDVAAPLTPTTIGASSTTASTTTQQTTSTTPATVPNAAPASEDNSGSDNGISLILIALAVGGAGGWLLRGRSRASD